jgi:hypothetical protein
MLLSERACSDFDLWEVERRPVEVKLMSDSPLVKYRNLDQGLLRRHGDSSALMQKEQAYGSARRASSRAKPRATVNEKRSYRE